MKTTIISLGGSLIVQKNIDTIFLKKFRKVILDYVNGKNKIVIVAGGGMINKEYNKAAKKITKISNEDLDWLGIACTKLNAELLRVIFSKYAYEKIVDNPNKKTRTGKRIIIGSGSKPGFSSDLDAVLLAKNFNSRIVVNMTNVDYVYDKDPKKYKNAKRFEELSWNDYIKIIGKKWQPKLSTPFDPIASKKAKSLGIQVIILNGKKLENLKNFLSGKRFKGTVIK